ncbi:MAG: type II toxin-antitoxin system RelE/ParE family toxin [Chloroflexaceae bacterium]|nr:type II toxin-antitoxin system RelE/ParE family toxin [Chloroflexaceae bacterium]
MSRYTVYVTPGAWAEIKRLPGNVRQRVRREIAALADNPQPVNSRQLQSSESEHTLWRLRLDRWRIVYLVTETDAIVDVLAVRRRPPYDYGDLSDLLEQLPDDTGA